jgi:hypothetical protein
VVGSRVEVFLRVSEGFSHYLNIRKSLDACYGVNPTKTHKLPLFHLLNSPATEPIHSQPVAYSLPKPNSLGIKQRVFIVG